MNFTYANYHRLCKAIAASKLQIVLKHDVEVVTKSTVDIAQIEREHGVRSIFFFQHDVMLSAPEQLDLLKGMGHSIGYHYDVLDNCLGDISRATFEFIENLKSFKRHGCDITWICPHGNPALERQGWNSNKDFFKNAGVRSRFGSLKDIVVDVDRLFPGYQYISDVGYGFRVVTSVSDNDRIKSVDIPVSDIISYISKVTADGIIISTHPHRWLSSPLSFTLKKALFKVLKRIYRLTHGFPLFALVYSKLFRLSRRF